MRVAFELREVRIAVLRVPRFCPHFVGARGGHQTGRLYVATGGDGKLRIYDGKSLTLQETFAFGGDADNVRYDEQTGNIWVGCGNGGLAMTNPAGQKVGSVDLGTHPESFHFEPHGDRVYVNVPRQFGIRYGRPEEASGCRQMGIRRSVRKLSNGFG